MPLPLSLTSASAFLPSTPSLPSLTIVVVTEPVSKSVIVMVWVPSPLSTTSPVMLPPFSPFAPVAPVSPFAPVAPVSPLAPAVALISMVEPLRLISILSPALIFTVFDALICAGPAESLVTLPFEPATAAESNFHETLLTISVTVLTFVKRDPYLGSEEVSNVAEPSFLTTEILPVFASTL